eukprot:TRINITY_DN1397_c0_g2_i1.p1 TRINITY_DN1397_c0_g2~~TRINITY_DN1397_c0_g2_i1.p1  ORF type:complete len:272 (-),score=38.54 TRINITY_DN1397_c0_g2_i1:135-950(-)
MASTPYLITMGDQPSDLRQIDGVHGKLKSTFGRFFERDSGARATDEESGNPYINLQEQDARLQEDFGRTASTKLRETLYGFVPGLPRKGEPQAASFKDSVTKLGIVKSLTPSFLQTDEDDDIASTCCPNLGFRQRVLGCVCCMVLGQVFQFLSFGSMMGVLVGHPGRFATFFSFGNILMVTASFFFSGPKQQCKKLRTNNRAPTFFAFLLTMVLTLVVVFGHPFFGRAIVILLLVIVQWVAQIWYILSYVPYGQKMGRAVAKRVLGCFFNI